MLAQHPPILHRLRQEILKQVGPHRRPTFDDFREMKFLRAVINGMRFLMIPSVNETTDHLLLETLRLYPAV